MALHKKNEFVPWIGETDFAEGIFNGLIVALETSRSPKGDDYTLVMADSRDQAIRKISVYGKNMQWLITHYGEDDEGWIGRTVRIEKRTVNGKTLKILC